MCCLCFVFSDHKLSEKTPINLRNIMLKLNREHVSVASLLGFLKAKHARIKKSGKPHTATTVSCLVGDIEDAMDEMGKQEPEEEDCDLERLLSECSFHLEGVAR